ncbi:AsnC family protein [Salmonella enterica subsp. enterica]|nr:AsnC family protein [Salmonella enterica subsp. enterica]EEG5547114.1 AsnC family protein [Salmonella enterica subsp. enterica]
MMHLKPMGTPGKCPAHCRTWTPEEDELLVNLYPSMTCNQIAITIGRSVSSVSHRVTLLREQERIPYKHRPLTPAQHRFIRDNRHTMTIKAVATTLGVGVSTVKYAARTMGISYRKYGDMHPRTKYPDSDIEFIRQLRDEHNLTFRKIGEKFDIHPLTCWKLYTNHLTAIDAIAREYLPR